MTLSTTKSSCFKTSHHDYLRHHLILKESGEVQVVVVATRLCVL